jgi:hypothetical protein
MPSALRRRWPGRPLVYRHDDRLAILKTITQTPPAPASRWTMAAIARPLDVEVGISASQVSRICRSLDLKPWQVRSPMTSHNPDFLAKTAEVCGLYLHPPEGAVVFSVDEKPGMQATSRVNPTRPAAPCHPTRQQFEYRRHRTAVLFAALDVHHGEVIPQISDRSRSANFDAFPCDLGRCCAGRPGGARDRRHLSAHKTPAVRESLAAHPRSPCTTPRPMTAGSTRSSCSSRSLPAGCPATASSTPSTTWPPRSWPSSRTTTNVPSPSLDLRRATPAGRLSHRKLEMRH